MAITTPSMGLKRWDQPNDIFSYVELSDNFALLDVHDHSSGKGVQIPTAGIVNSAIDATKLADNAVTTNKLAALAVSTAKLQDGAVSVAKLASGAVSYVTYINASTNGATTTSSTPSVIPDLTYTGTFRAGTYLAFFTGTFSHSVSGQYIDFSFGRDGSQFDNGRRVETAAANNNFSVSLVSAISIAAAGSHTIDVRWATGAATATARTFQRSLLLLQI